MHPGHDVFSGCVEFSADVYAAASARKPRVGYGAVEPIWCNEVPLEEPSSSGYVTMAAAQKVPLAGVG